VAIFAPGDPPAAWLKRGESLVTARLVRAASGAKYEAAPGIVFWTRGDEALAEWPQGARFTCRVRE
jgi:membrane-bound inhibitor of C-type lysozyme